MPGVAGKIIGLKVNGAFVACETSCTLNFDREMLPASALDSGGWKEFLYGDRGWNMSVDAGLLLQSVGADIKSILMAAFIDSLPLYVQFSTRPSVNIQLTLSGLALVSGGSITAAMASASSWNCNFQGTGPLTPSYNDYDLLIDAMPEFEDYPIIVSEQVF